MDILKNLPVSVKTVKVEKSDAASIFEEHNVEVKLPFRKEWVNGRPEGYEMDGDKNILNILKETEKGSYFLGSVHIKMGSSLFTPGFLSYQNKNRKEGEPERKFMVMSAFSKDSGNDGINPAYPEFDETSNWVALDSRVIGQNEDGSPKVVGSSFIPKEVYDAVGQYCEAYCQSHAVMRAIETSKKEENTVTQQATETTGEV